MGRSQESFSKKEKEKKRAKKREDKEKRKAERKANSKSGEGFDNMIAYVDEFGNVTETPPDPKKKVEIEAEEIVLGVPKKEKIEEDPIKKGRVDFFDHSKGFGFIKETLTGESFFVHINGCNDEITEGNSVSFELEMGRKGLNAVNVNKV